VLGLLSALVGWLFIKGLYKCEDLFDAIKIPYYLKPAVGGLFLGCIGLYFPQIFGVGYPSIEQTLNGQLGPMLVLGLIALKIIATSLTLGSGGSGGVFAPSLFIGAMLGSSFGSMLHLIFPGILVSPGAYALVGMAAVFAGAAQAPISAILILFEMTGDYKIILPLMVACVISTLVLKWISKDSIYTLKLRRRGIDILKLKNEDLLEKIKVSEAMFRKVITINESATVSDAESLLKSSSHRGFPVLDSNGRLKGMITHQDIYDALKNGRGDIAVAEIMSYNLVVCFPGETLKNALEKLGEHDIGRIPVIENNDTGKLIGLITRKNIVSAYNKFLHGN
jgi:CIC family chloride channel protein